MTVGHFLMVAITENRCKRSTEKVLFKNLLALIEKCLKQVVNEFLGICWRWQGGWLDVLTPAIVWLSKYWQWGVEKSKTQYLTPSKNQYVDSFTQKINNNESGKSKIDSSTFPLGY